MGYPRRILPHYTYEDWVHWEGQWELIDGFPFAMSPMAIPKHQRIAAALAFELGLALRESGCKNCHIYDPIDYKISEDTIVQPDVLLICGKIEKKYLDFPPVLLIEVLSPSTAIKDRHTKFDIYQQQGVKYYLIVDIEKEIIEIYELINKAYQLQPTTDLFDFILGDDFKIAADFSAIW